VLKKEKMKHFKEEMEFSEIINFLDTMDIKHNKITSKIMGKILKIS
jgi:hypothetical protein